ncbi:unnamed protein product [Cyprideis torosa]|uniref:lysophospholipase n=1 Tax=Cyprideis torosa TaxID=163714 RepID=A0A7R8W3V3_9CRUS|nr:unnamed protein product [Cyprideis torosa]CAG0883445.1 unnamed protein product [Cyprideis torosa]
MGVADVLKGTELIPDFGGIEDDWLAIVYEFKLDRAVKRPAKAIESSKRDVLRSLTLVCDLASHVLAAAELTLGYWSRSLQLNEYEMEVATGGHLNQEEMSREGVDTGTREQAERVATVGSRFRKRDKVLFYGRKVLRTVKSISGQVRNGPRSLTKQPRRVVRLARQFLRMKKDSTPTHVFGHFDRPVFLELCKHINTLNLMAGNVLFTIGDPDDSVYVVQSGLIEVFVATDSGLALSLKLVQPGEPLFSLLSFADVLTGHTNPFKTVSARAVEDSTILRLPMHAFSLVFDSHPDLFVRVMQVILIRLQRITFTALLQYLGLTSQILVPTNTPPAPPSPVRTTAAASVPSRGEYTPPPLHLQDSGQGGSGTEGEGPPHEEGRSRYIRGFRALSRQETEAFTRQAKEGLTEVLGLQGSEDTLDGKIGIREGIHGTYLVKQESHKDSAIYYVLSGTLSISLRDEEAGHDRVLFLAHPGQIVGGLSVLTGEPSFFSVRIKGGPGLVAFIKKQHLYSIMAVQPRVVLHIVNSLIRILSPVVRQVDFALDWTTMEAGKAIYRQDEEADCMYIILSGRLRSVLSLPSGKKDLVGEHGRGDLVGVVEMITKRPRGTSVIAVRDSELVRVSAGLLNHLKMKFPQIVTKLIQLLGHRIMAPKGAGKGAGKGFGSGIGSWQRMSSPTSLSTLPAELRQTQSNLSTIALLAVTDDVPLSPFALELLHTLSVIGPCIRLTSDSIRKELGAQITNEGNEYQLNHWLQKQEDYHRMVLYQCDSTLTNWTKQCIRQADCILIVALASREPSVGKIEYQLDKLAVRTQKELVLLHREDSPLPRKTAAWLNMRSWCSFHHHIRCPPRMFAKKSQSKICVRLPLNCRELAGDE